MRYRPLLAAAALVAAGTPTACSPTNTRTVAGESAVVFGCDDFIETRYDDAARDLVFSCPTDGSTMSLSAAPTVIAIGGGLTESAVASVQVAQSTMHGKRVCLGLVNLLPHDNRILLEDYQFNFIDAAGRNDPKNGGEPEISEPVLAAEFLPQQLACASTISVRTTEALNLVLEESSLKRSDTGEILMPGAARAPVPQAPQEQPRRQRQLPPGMYDI